MSFIHQLNTMLDQYHLLKHPFYQAWNDGTLSNDILQSYAKQYYKHVAAFPRYISAIHSLSDNIKHRQILLDNLIEEEQGEENHPELWMRFAEGLGCERESVETEEQEPSTQSLVDGYFGLTRNNFAKGLGALYAYERQTPEVAKTKIDGLEKFYGVKDERALKFFKVHMSADQWHSEECANIIMDLKPEEQKLAYEGAKQGAKLLWKFLDGISELMTNECRSN